MIVKFVCSGLELGTLDSLLSGYLIKRTTGFDSPVVRVDVSDNGNYIGANLGSALYGRRLMSIEGEIIGADASDYEAKRRALEDAFNVLKGLQRATITTRAGLVVRCDVILNTKPELPYEGMVIRGEFRIELVAPFPYFLADIGGSVSVSIFEGGGGEVPSAIPFDMSTGLSSATVITNDGNVEAFPIIRIYGDITDPQILNETTGKSISINYEIEAGEYVELDFYKHTAKLSDGTNIFQYVSGDWWTLGKGNNTIKLIASAYVGDARADVIYQDTYIGI